MTALIRHVADAAEEAQSSFSTVQHLITQVSRMDQEIKHATEE